MDQYVKLIQEILQITIYKTSSDETNLYIPRPIVEISPVLKKEISHIISQDKI